MSEANEMTSPATEGSEVQTLVINPCVRCKHLTSDTFCTRHKNELLSYELVTGRPIYGFDTVASRERDTGGCGKNGRYFEPSLTARLLKIVGL